MRAPWRLEVKRARADRGRDALRLRCSDKKSKSRTKQALAR
jgi:hypothetical protein